MDKYLQKPELKRRKNVQGKKDAPSLRDLKRAVGNPESKKKSKKRPERKKKVNAA